MRRSLVILAAATAGFSLTPAGSSPTAAATLVPLVHESVVKPHASNLIEVRYRRWHRHRSGDAAAAGLLGLGAGLLLGHLSAPRTYYYPYGAYPQYYSYPRYHTYGGDPYYYQRTRPHYRVYGGDPYPPYGVYNYRRDPAMLDARPPYSQQ